MGQQWVRVDSDIDVAETALTQQSTGIAVPQRQPNVDSFGTSMLSVVASIRRDFVPESQKCAYLGENTAGNALFDLEEPYEGVSPPDQYHRLLALIRYWNMVEYWFPYRDLIDEDWHSVLVDSVRDFRDADTLYTYRSALLRLIVRIDDTHAWLWTAGDAMPPGGWAMSPVAVRSVEGRPFVWKRLETKKELEEPGIRLGDVILAVGGRAVPDLLKEWRAFYGASNESAFLRDAYQNLLRGAGEQIEVTVERGGEALDVTTPLVPMGDVDRTPTFTNEHVGETFQVIEDDIAYLKLSTLQEQDLPRYIEQIIGKRGLIIDIRGYPRTFVVFSLGQHLVAKTTPIAKFTWPNPNRPGEFYWSQTLEIQPKEPIFEGSVAILIDERSQSQSEYTAMAFRSSPNAVVFGSQTAGADGNVSRIVLPGGERTTFSGMGVFYPNGSPTQQIGILPDYEVRPTLDGLRNGRDEVLEAAIRFIAHEPLSDRD